MTEVSNAEKLENDENERVVSMGGEVNSGHLRAFIERVERLTEEKKAIADDIKEVYSEAKANGFQPKILKAIVKLRKQDRNQRIEEETILSLYMDALGIE